ncbi:MAG: DUF433 domain-containing protein [Anaerolineae bacterium]|nr:DUF433 domain-containing protein [Anaerolineae bacterium]
MAVEITEIIPLMTDEYGVIRVGGTRVPLETVVSSFEQGATAEQIVYQFPALKLADVYAVISYYLNHRKEMELYIKKVQTEEQRAQRFVDDKFDQRGIRD